MENKELPEKYVDEKTGIEYGLVGDYYIPNLVLPYRKNVKLGKYGRMRARYLKEHKKAEYTIMLMENTLQDHLIEIDKTANERYDLLMKQFVEKENITEELKTTNQLEWVGKMKNIKNAVEEIILKELIYV
ncbi:MAG: TnpV protein [Clostridia bacterium]|nr:TnpV protein [Clostridia bacterium]